MLVISAMRFSREEAATSALKVAGYSSRETASGAVSGSSRTISIRRASARRLQAWPRSNALHWQEPFAK
jgi:hypothetical protein